jgi:hypothetical protein
VCVSPISLVFYAIPVVYKESRFYFFPEILVIFLVSLRLIEAMLTFVWRIDTYPDLWLYNAIINLNFGCSKVRDGKVSSLLALVTDAPHWMFHGSCMHLSLFDRSAVSVWDNERYTAVCHWLHQLMKKQTFGNIVYSFYADMAESPRRIHCTVTNFY